MLGLSTEDFKGGHIVTVRVVCLVCMTSDGVTEGDNQVVDGSGPPAGVVSRECESGDCLPVVEVANEVEGEGVDLVKGAQEPLCTRRPSKRDIESHIFGNAVVESFLSFPTWRTGKDKEGEEECRKEMSELCSHTVSLRVGLC